MAFYVSMCVIVLFIFSFSFAFNALMLLIE